jgi:hypothetical protein
MLDFGPTPVAGDSLTNSPYHAENGSFSGTIWNQVQKDDLAPSELRWADGALARTVSLNIGATTKPDVTLIDLNIKPSGSHSLSGASNRGVYEGATVGGDAIYNGVKHGHARAIGVQIGGLTPGGYTVYVIARNTNGTEAQSQHVHVGTETAAGDFDFTKAGYTRRSLRYRHGADAIDRWTENVNYAKFTVSVEAGGVLNIAVQGGEEQERRGFLNCVQIVPHSPEGSVTP